jgi:hypothetical protein
MPVLCRLDFNLAYATVALTYVLDRSSSFLLFPHACRAPEWKPFLFGSESARVDPKLLTDES